MRQVPAQLLLALLAFTAISIPASAQEEGGDARHDGELFTGPVYDTEKLAKLWDLEEDEIERYQELSVVDRQFSSPTITPYEVLGKYARSLAEQERYAELYVRQAIDQAVRTMEWGLTVEGEAGEGTKRALETIDRSPIIAEHLAAADIPREVFARAVHQQIFGSSAPEPSREKGRASLFLDLQDCEESCSTAWSRLRMRQLRGEIAAIDVVAVDHDGKRATREDLTSWALEHGISPAEVSATTVTLNFETARYRGMLNGRDTPIAITDGGEVLK